MILDAAFSRVVNQHSVSLRYDRESRALSPQVITARASVGYKVQQTTQERKKMASLFLVETNPHRCVKLLGVWCTKAVSYPTLDMVFALHRSTDPKQGPQQRLL